MIKDIKQGIPKKEPKNKRKLEIEAWFQKEYMMRKAKISRYKYLGLECDETLYELENEAYEKEQEYREIVGLDPLPEIKRIDII